MRRCVVTAHWAGCAVLSGTVWRNSSWTPFGQNPRCSCPKRKHKLLKEKCWKQFLCCCVVSQCHCQHGLIWSEQKLMVHCDKHFWYSLWYSLMPPPGLKLPKSLLISSLLHRDGVVPPWYGVFHLSSMVSSTALNSSINCEILKGRY